MLLLIDKAADVNARGGEYGNALHTALLASHESVVQQLLQHGALEDSIDRLQNRLIYSC